DQMTWVDEAELADDDPAPVSSLRTVAGIPEARHELGDDASDALGAVAGLTRFTQESVARQRQSHHVKRILRSATIACRLGKRPDDLRKLEERSRPTVYEDQWRRLRLTRALMNKMEIDPVDVDLELRKQIERALLRSPIKRCAPVRYERFQISKVRPIVPARTLDLIGETCTCEPLPEIHQHRVRHRNSKRHRSGG